MKISANCYAVTGLGYSAPWCVNAGIVAGAAKTLVVDTGANALAGATIYGYAAAVRPGNEIVVVNSEKHFDHVGGNGFFRAQGCAVWGHPGVRRTEAEFEAERSAFNRGIENAARREAHEEAVFFGGTAVANPDQDVRAGTVFDLGGCRAEVLFTPGHTPTNISIWTPADRVLFTGDCLINGYLPNLDAGGPGDWQRWLLSLDLVEQLKPDFVVAGHGPVARGQEQVAEMIERVRGILEKAIALGRSPTE